MTAWWKRLFAEPAAAPQVIYLELEEIVAMLLERDLGNPGSLAWLTLFEPELREKVLAEMDGVRGCWNRHRLSELLETEREGGRKGTSPNASGTAFFWGVNPEGRRVPFGLYPSGKGEGVLRGVDDRAQPWEIPYTPQSLLEALGENRLLPSLFTCFLVVCFARGLTCLGGYYQNDYLPRMQKGLVRALRKAGGYDSIADSVEGVESCIYLSGMQTVMVRIEEGILVPAGPVEIVAGGSLTDEDMEKTLSLTVREAHLASLFETIPDILPSAVNGRPWKMELAAGCDQLLGEKVVVK